LSFPSQLLIQKNISESWIFHVGTGMTLKLLHFCDR